MKPSLPYFTLLIVLLGMSSMLGQDLQELPPETEDMPYIAVDRDDMQKSPAYNRRSADFFTTQVNVDENGMNIVGDAANEPSIAVDPTNPDRIVIGWRQFDTTASNFRQAGYGFSSDGGLTFTFPGVIDPGLFRSDPVLDFDRDGNFYYNSLQNDFTCQVFGITDGGFEWGPAVEARGGDKQWMRIDRSGGEGDRNNYSYWNVSFTTCSPGDFTRSSNQANSFEECVALPGSPRWGTLTVDNDGTLYVVGNSSSGIIVVRSFNAKEEGSTIEWETPVNVNLDGFMGVGSNVNPVGLLGQAWVDVDVSGGAGEGNVYVLSTVVRNSVNDPGDVMFARSTDGGESFQAPIRIGGDPGTDATQWFGTMSVAPNGRIDVIWLDNRDAAPDTDSVLYYTFSEDQGETWAPETVLSDTFDPNIGYPQQDKMGDYFDMVSDNEGAHLAWANTLNGGQDVYYTRITPQELSIQDVVNDLEISAVPNPFSDKVVLRYSGAHQGLSARVYDLQGRLLTHLKEDPQNGQLQWDGRDGDGVRMSSGLYLIEWELDDRRGTLKVVLQ